MTRDAVPFVQALAGTLLAAAVPDVAEAERAGAARFTAERLTRAPTVTAFGLRLVGGALRAQVRLVDRRPFAALAADERDRWVARWSARPLPGLTDYLDAVRSLTLTWLYEHRAA